MGIGNRRAERPCRHAQAHYPSWGSETQPFCPAGVDSAMISLPLMGIGNFSAQLDALGSTSKLLLITPHGDRKLASARSTQRCWTHYPAWGSETPVASTVSSSVTISLPLMGIGNSGGKRGRRVYRSGLITPHGSGNMSTRTHYPSWGSETGGIGHAGIAGSLRIGTAACRVVPGGIRTHYPSWGSETPSPTKGVSGINC